MKLIQKAIYFFILFLLEFIGPIYSQAPAIKNKFPTSGDCKTARNISLDKTIIYGPTEAPSGYGTTQEIRGNNVQIFEEEHNTAWYLLEIQKSGKLVFDIIPTDTTNDYDFLLYSYSDSSFCDAFFRNRIKPLRSNLSNVKKSVRGVTGLASKGS